MRAVVLASFGAEGLRPFTYTTSTAMLPVLGQPLLEPTLLQLARSGFDEIVVTTAEHPRQIENYFRDGRRWGVRLAYAFQGERRGGAYRGSRFGSAAALRRLQERSGFIDRTVAVVRAEIWSELDLGELIGAHWRIGAPVSFAPAPAGAAIAFVEPSAIDAVPADDDAADLERDLAPALGAATALAPYDSKRGFQARVLQSTADYWELLQAALRGEAADLVPYYPEIRPGVRVGVDARVEPESCRLRGPLWIGGGAVIAPGAEIIGPGWIGAGCIIGPHVRLERCVVEDNTRLEQQLELRERIVVGNRAVNPSGEVEILVGADPGDSDRRDRRRSDRESLLQLATRVDRRY